jgi:hypothetical protein
MQELAILLEQRDIPFDPQDNRIMCFPHIINICVQHVIEKITNWDLADLEFDDSAVPSPSPHSKSAQSFQQAAARDPISLCRSIVCAIRGSGNRRDDFEEIIEINKGRPWCQLNGQDIQQRELLRDVKTRWDSVYQMVRRVREMRPVSFHYNSPPPC